jgi:sugar (pentulose or hexulose) kinase
MTLVLVGLDMGTTRIKAVGVDLTGCVVGETAQPTPWRHRGAEADCDPRELADIARQVICDLVFDSRWPADAEVAGIGVTGMAEAGVLVDGNGEPLAPALAWHDPRGEVQVLESAVGSAEFGRHVGMRLNSKPSVAKILWLQRNVSSAASAVRHLCIAEWIVFSLGGDQVGEYSLTSRTGLLDVVTRTPWAATLDLVGPLLPDRLVLAGDPCGRTSLPAPFASAVLTVAGMDHQSAAFASGAAVSGTLFDSLGTAEAFLRFTPATLTRVDLHTLVEEDAAVLWSVIPDHVCLLAATLAGLSLQRILALLGVGDRGARAALATAALSTDRSGSGLTLDPASHRGLRLSGIDDDASPALLWRVAVEDLFAQGQHCVDVIERVAGARSSTVLAGGWINDPMVIDAKRRQLGDFRVSEIGEAGAVGAAMLGGIAAGVIRRPASDSPPEWPESSASDQ